MYLYIQFTIKNPEAFQLYANSVGETVQAYGGKTLAVSKSPDPIEGQVVADVCVIQQWPSQAAVEKWLNSAEDAPLKQLRHECAMEKLVMIPLSDVSQP